MKIRLKAIKFGVDFRKNELTNWNIFRKSKDYKRIGTLTRSEAVLFVSVSGNQLLFILNTTKLNRSYQRGGFIYELEPRQVIDTRRLRLEGTAPWNPMMLSNYAKSVGLELIGFKSFETQYREAQILKKKK